jgi:hypothetical protein
MAKARPHTVKHDNKTGIHSPSPEAPDRGRTWPTTSVGSGSRPVPGRAPIASGAPSSQNRNYLPDRHSVKPGKGR